MTINEYFTDLEKKENRTWGQTYAMRAWEESERYETEKFEVNELPWGSMLKEVGMEDFVSTLREAGVDTFVVTEHSTSLMEGLHALFATGCSLVGPATVTRHSDYWGDENHIGLEFKIN